MDEEIRVCSMCGCELQENETVEVDGEAVCDECAEQYTTTCDHCGETIWAEDAVTDEHMNLCSCCFDDHYRRCENCGRLVQHTPGHRKKRFCSDACRWTWWNSHPDRVKRKAYYTLTCCQCGEEFDSYGNQNRKFCSRECYYASRRSVQPGQSDAVSCVAGAG